MDDDREQTTVKIMLLMQRERELFAMRTKVEQVTQWLKLTQSLSALFDASCSVAEIYARLRKALISGLRLQRVSFFEIGAEVLTPIVPAGRGPTHGSVALSFLHGRPSGFCNDPDEPGVVALAEAVALRKFFWSTIQVANQPPVLLAAGFEPSRSSAQSALEENGAAQIDNAARHIGSLFENHALVSQLKLEKEGLERANLALQRRDEELETVGQELRVANESLERRVSERTAELAQRNRELHLVLDNVNQAFLTIDVCGCLAREHSAIGDLWFGPYPENARFSDYIGAKNPAFAEHFQLSFEALLDDVLPLEVCLEQLPSQLQTADREYSCAYFALKDGERVNGLVIVLSDITEQVRRKKREAEYAELLALFQCFIRDRPSYLTFVREADQIVQRLAEESLDSVTQKRLLHTLKGNAAGVMGHRLVVNLCHSAEDQLSGDREGSASQTIRALIERWHSVRRAMGVANDQANERTLEVPIEQLALLREEIRLGYRSAALARSLVWQTEPALQPLARLGTHARDLARRLNKGALDLHLEAPEIRLDLERGASVWASLVHVVRNAVDHGFEPAAERLAANKPALLRLDLRLYEVGDHLVIEIEDDGRGIDWAVVRKLAAARELPHETEQELVLALLAPGLSTKGELTSISGRGMGMSAVDAQVQAAGGSVGVTSKPSRGTRWRFSLPRAALAPSAPPPSSARARSTG